MNTDVLRKWLAGDLEPSRMREVSRWLILNTEPDTAAVMRGLLRDQAQANADTSLLARAPGLQWLVNAWNQRLEAGLAELSVGEGAPPVLAFADTSEEHVSLCIGEKDDGLMLEVDKPSHWTVFVSSDAPHVGVVTLSPTPDGLWTAPVDLGLGDRITYWLCSTGPSEASPEDALKQALTDPLVKTRALRYEPR